MFQKYLNKELYNRDWSQRELAGKVGVHESLVSRWMKGERVPTLPNIIKLAILFETSVDVILEKMGKMDV
ncbi:MAG: helix-turn-helix domain-containing protein [Vampirovibrionia bacterium]